MHRLLQRAHTWLPLMFLAKDCAVWVILFRPEDEMTAGSTTMLLLGLLPSPMLLPFGGIIAVAIANLLIAFCAGIVVREWAGGSFAQSH
jgi:hypothetical protein